MDIITYGILVSKSKFNTISENNRSNYLNKPLGCGLWGSPINSDWGWKDWCEANSFRLETFKTYTKWRLRNPNKILVIDSFEDLEKAMDKYGFDNSIPFPPEAMKPSFIEELMGGIHEYRLDFWKIKEDGYDGMMLTEKGNAECHLPIGKRYKGRYIIDLNSWDCESIVVWNWNQIQIIEKGRLL